MSDPEQGEARTNPRAIGKYRIIGVLGSGGMGVVYKAYDAAIDRFVALKTIRTELLEGAEASEWRARFRREARAAARCQHPNIVTVFEYGEQNGTAFIAMEYVTGRSLLDVLAEQGRLAQEVALSIIAQVLDALDYSHAHGVVHRDIKPSNIILLEGGGIKVTDFGIARIESLTVTQTLAFVGTPIYMAPERFTGGIGDHRSDLFALGVILFELLTGERPFPGRTTTEVMYRVLHHPPRDATVLNPAVPAALSAVMQRALARDPAARYQNAADFAAALKQAAAADPALTVVNAPTDDPIDTAGTTAGDVAGDAPREPSMALPAPSASPPKVSPATRGGSPGWLPDAVLRKVEEDLAFHIGPLARILVKKAAPGVGGIAALYAALAEHIRDEAERAEFLRKAPPGATAGTPTGGPQKTGPQKTEPQKTGTQGQTGVGWLNTDRRRGASAAPPSPAGPPAGDAAPTEADLERVRRELTVSLGPIAQILVRKAAQQATSLAGLYRLLAEHIPDEQERAAFLGKAPPQR